MLIGEIESLGLRREKIEEQKGEEKRREEERKEKVATHIPFSSFIGSYYSLVT